jgi:5-methylcytosine-specific restriction endonuclease McrA
VTGRVGFCPEHLAEQRKVQDAKKPKYHRLYKTARWRKMRNVKLQMNPLCERCGTIAQLAHHVVPHEGDTSLFYSIDNLESLCTPCHEHEHKRFG